MDKKTLKDLENRGACSGTSSPTKSDSSRASTPSQLSIDRDLGLPTCRVCQCVESDHRGDAALGFLGIDPPQKDSHNLEEVPEPEGKGTMNNVKEDTSSLVANQKMEPGYVQFVSPTGEVFVCCTDLEIGACHNRDQLIELGCSCKNDLALVHYACALKWFVNHGSTVCEICGCVANNIRIVDFKKVLASLKDYEALRDRTSSGVPNPAQVHDTSGVDPDAIAAIRRQRLSEIYLWFNPHGNLHHNNVNSENVPPVLVVTEPPTNAVVQEATPPQNTATKWAVEGTGILLATGLLTVILAWLIAPRVGKVSLILKAIACLKYYIVNKFSYSFALDLNPFLSWSCPFLSPKGDGDEICCCMD